jgi:hypothetical protein
MSISQPRSPNSLKGKGSLRNIDTRPYSVATEIDDVFRHDELDQKAESHFYQQQENERLISSSGSKQRNHLNPKHMIDQRHPVSPRPTNSLGRDSNHSNLRPRQNPNALPGPPSPRQHSLKRNNSARSDRMPGPPSPRQQNMTRNDPARSNPRSDGMHQGSYPRSPKYSNPELTCGDCKEPILNLNESFEVA